MFDAAAEALVTDTSWDYGRLLITAVETAIGCTDAVETGSLSEHRFTVSMAGGSHATEEPLRRIITFLRCSIQKGNFTERNIKRDLIFNTADISLHQ